MPHLRIRRLLAAANCAAAALAFALLPACAALPSGAPAALFNGRDLDGWECYLAADGAGIGDVWRVEDGVLVCAGEPRGYLYTAADYRDFHLVVEWRWPGEPGNSGVLLRVTPAPQMLPPCAEAQLKSGSAGDMYGFHDYRIGGDPTRLSEFRLPGWRLARIGDAERPAGEWNRYEITVDGGDITLILNGVVVNEARGCDVRAGRIALQSEGGEVHFRKVELTPR